MATVEELMNYEADERWHKKLGKDRFVVSKRQLRKLYPNLCTADTQPGTRKAANQWWLDKLESLKAETANADLDKVQRQQFHQEMLDHYRATGDDDNAALTENYLGLQADIPKVAKREPTLAKVLAEFPEISHSGTDQAAMLRAKTTKAPANLRCDVNAKEWLDSMLLNVKTKSRSVGHYDNLRRELNRFLAFFGSERSVAEIDGGELLRYHNHLKQLVVDGTMSTASADRIQGTAKSWITWLWEINRLANLPRNIKSPSLVFTITTPEPVPWSKDEIHMVLAHCKDKPMECWLRLMANVGFTQIDVAQLEHDQIDWKHGLLTDRRGKTIHTTDKAPTVTFPLWPRTFELMKRFRSTDPKLVFLNEEGKPLLVDELDETNKRKKNDVIQSQYYDLKLAVKKANPTWEHKTLKQFRKTGPSIISGTEFDSLATLFLRNVSEGITDKHYKAAAHGRLAKAVEYIGKELDLID